MTSTMLTRLYYEYNTHAFGVFDFTVLIVPETLRPHYDHCILTLLILNNVQSAMFPPALQMYIVYTNALF